MSKSRWSDNYKLTAEARTSGRCSQCGKPFHERACGPTHAVAAELYYAETNRGTH
ncbi:hypothetical protein [Thermoactinospora rubra]|uniref:hypothetical protein n=1 Tax=Thermoactinospora rubra TaxID=1088767 RepID=UPI001301F8B8|nr:hypothetical protein [Thermoactinospora rubra]